MYTMTCQYASIEEWQPRPVFPLQIAPTVRPRPRPRPPLAKVDSDSPTSDDDSVSGDQGGGRSGTLTLTATALTADLDVRPSPACGYTGDPESDSGTSRESSGMAGSSTLSDSSDDSSGSGSSSTDGGSSSSDEVSEGSSDSELSSPSEGPSASERSTSSSDSLCSSTSKLEGPKRSTGVGGPKRREADRAIPGSNADRNHRKKEGANAQGSAERTRPSAAARAGPVRAPAFTQQGREGAVCSAAARTGSGRNSDHKPLVSSFTAALPRVAGRAPPPQGERIWTRGRRADFSLTAGRPGDRVVVTVDTTVISHLAKSNRTQRPADVLNAAAARKTAVYGRAYPHFIPFPITQTGGITEGTRRDLIKGMRKLSLSCRGQKAHDWEIGMEKMELLQRLATAVIRVQAALVDVTSATGLCPRMHVGEYQEDGCRPPGRNKPPMLVRGAGGDNASPG